MVVLFLPGCASTKYLSNYQDVPIIYDDLVHMRNLLQTYSPEEINAEVIQKAYFKRGTKGLRALIAKDGLDAESFSHYVVKNYQFLTEVTSKTAFIQKDSGKMRDLLLAFDQLIENPRYQPTYFVIGQGKHGGTRTGEGFVIEIQRNVLGLNGIDFSEVDTSWMKPYQDIDQLWVHEQVHVSREVQPLSHSLLRMSLDEGSCDFIAYLITRKKGNPATYAYGYENEQKLYEAWKKDLEKDATRVRSKWVWNWGTERPYPPDLGYFIGFRIAESYYQEQQDKTQAIQDIHDMENYEVLYEKSTY